jgi:3-mercaptopyruvate sulfurtransferase SseA
MATDAEWAEKVKGLLKSELKRRNISYRELAEKLSALGISETERNIANKISRGGFTAVFLIQCLEAIGSQSLRLD